MKDSWAHVLWACLVSGSPACATVNGVLNEPISGGLTQRYEAPPDSLKVAAARAFAGHGLRVVRDTTVGGTRLLLGTKGASLLGWGEIDQAAITPGAKLAEVWIVSRPRLRLSLDPNRSPRLFQALDRELGNLGPKPLPGDRVRLTLSAPKARVTGIVQPTSVEPESLAIDVGEAVRVIAAADVERISLSRGSYGHAKEGAILDCWSAASPGSCSLQVKRRASPAANGKASDACKDG